MYKKLFAGILLMLIATQIGMAQQPPILDRELFFGDPEISGAQISPDGKFISFIKPFNNVRNIWVKGINEKFEDAHPLTADTKRPVTGYFWSQDSRYILYVQDQGGNENFRIYAVNPMEKGDPVPAARDLTPFENVRAQIYSVPKHSPNEIFVGLNDRNPQLHDVYRLNLTTGERTLLRKNDDGVAAWVFDLQGNLRLGIRQTADGGSEILKIEGESLVSIYSHNSEESAAPVRFTPDGKKFYLISNKGNEIDKMQLYLFDLADNSKQMIDKDPLDEVDIDNAIFSDVTDELIATTYEADRTRIYFRDKEYEAAYNKLKSLLPEGEVSVGSQTADEKIWLVYLYRDVDPGSAYIYDVKQGEVELLYRSRPNLPTEYLAEMKPVRYTARDGVVVPAYLTLPKGMEAQNLPVIMFIHGGPWARDGWGYNSMAQFLANRGYAVLQPNFRGSTGYGKKFLNLGNKQWGRGTMQHDITDGVAYLVKEGIADPKRVAIAGGSYGGYATLAGLAFTPDLYACGFDIVGPSNIITLLNSIPPYWAPIKKMFDIRVGDMNNPDELKMLEHVSPLNYAKEIKKPLFVVQGANDPRVKVTEADQIVVAMRDLGRQVEYMLAADEGHGFAGKENRLAMVTAMEQFFAKHLNGRVQTDVKDEINTQLKKLMVDITTVKLPETSKTDAAAAEVLTSFDASKVKYGTTVYSMTVNAMGQKIALNMSRTVKKVTVDGEEKILLLDDVTGMMAVQDSILISPATLLPLKRTIDQGMAKVSLVFEEKQVTGSMEAGGQNTPLTIATQGPVLSDGAVIELAMSTLDLKDGYTAMFDVAEMMSGKVTRYVMNVLGTETLKLKSGDYQVFKVELKPADGSGETGLFWLDTKDKIALKIEQKLPAQAGGGSVTTEIVR